MSTETLDRFNRTEMVEIIRRYTGKIVKRSLPEERLWELTSQGAMAQPRPDELSGTMKSRASLEKFIVNNWAKINSQLPCSGENYGRCSVYQCSEGRHLSCFMSVPPHLLV